jgi:hypothetical protein
VSDRRYELLRGPFGFARFRPVYFGERTKQGLDPILRFGTRRRACTMGRGVVPPHYQTGLHSALRQKSQSVHYATRILRKKSFRGFSSISGLFSPFFGKEKLGQLSA